MAERDKAFEHVAIAAQLVRVGLNIKILTFFICENIF
jgi:hypothetical protein